MSRDEFLELVSKAITVASKRSDFAWGHLAVPRRLILKAANGVFDPALEGNDKKQLRDAARSFAAFSDYFYWVSEVLREFSETMTR